MRHYTRLQNFVKENFHFLVSTSKCPGQYRLRQIWPRLHSSTKRLGLTECPLRAHPGGTANTKD
jgi:hypothetical protein